MAVGARPPDLTELVRVQDRWTFLYVEHSLVSRDSNAVTVTDRRGTVHVPAATISAMLLGPGTNITHQGILVLAESGATTVWVGEQGVRYYAHGRPLARSTRLLDRQAEVVTNRTKRLAVARKMYQMRFIGEDVSTLTMQQLRGREGARVRRTYREHSRRTGVPWSGREFAPGDFLSSDMVNQALSAATTALYGITHAVVVSLGLSPGLGIIHTGHDRSFVYDIADLYKAELAIPTAFDVAALEPPDPAGLTRRMMRDRMLEAKLLERIVRDIQVLMADHETTGMDEFFDVNVVMLWDSAAGGDAIGGRNYASEFDDESFMDDPWS